MSGFDADVCIFTFAVDRPRELARCIASVVAQTGMLRIRHRILSERADTLRHHPALAVFAKRVEWQQLAGEPFQGASSQRMARLRAAALQQVTEPFVCFVDDDNEIAPDHIASLHRLIVEQRLDAAHSWRLVLTPDGQPFAFDHYPWHSDPVVADRIYRWCVAQGVIVPGDPVMRDGRIGAVDGSGYDTVDMNEWLFRTDPLRRIGFDTDFAQEEVRLRIGEDDKLYRRLLAAGALFACSRQPSVRYYLGGVSNLRLTSGPTLET